MGGYRYPWEIRRNDTGQIALSMIDTEYNDRSFFVRECSFTGGQDPFTRLKRALKPEIDEEAWAALNRTESRPFVRPQPGRIAVKVINDYGDEGIDLFATRRVDVAGVARPSSPAPGPDGSDRTPRPSSDRLGVAAVDRHC